MSRESKCEHDIAEQETAVAEHLCPLCLDMKVIELKALRKANINLWYKEQTRRQVAEAKLEAVREALHQISLCSANSASSKSECGKIARTALEQQMRQ